MEPIEMLSMSFRYENAMKDLKLLIGLSFQCTLFKFEKSIESNAVWNAIYLNLKSLVRVMQFECKLFMVNGNGIALEWFKLKIW